MHRPSPLVAGIAGAIAARIHQGDLSLGRALPSERDLSQEFGASRMVIRAAIRELERRGLVECRDRCRPVVRAAPAHEGAPNQKTVAIWLWPHAADFGASLILKGIQSVQADPDLRITIAAAVGDDWSGRIASEARFLRQIAADPQIVGAIVWYLGSGSNLGVLKQVKTAGKPIVFVDRHPGHCDDFDYVGTDNKNSAEAVVKHLIELGHRSIACLSNRDPASSVAERVEGYRSALSSAGIAFRPEFVIPIARDDEASIQSALNSLFALPLPPTALFAINDHIALQTHEQLLQRGLQIPKDVSVAGFDGLLRWVPGGGHLTSAKQNFERIGQLAMELLIDRIEEGVSSACRHFLLEAPLALQGSTGPALVSATLPQDAASSEVIS